MLPAADLLLQTNMRCVHPSGTVAGGSTGRVARGHGSENSAHTSSLAKRLWSLTLLQRNLLRVCLGRKRWEGIGHLIPSVRWCVRFLVCHNKGPQSG